ncbi:MAG: hypothetical protein R3B09_32365 [Nannocystaceae bacterium]
MLGPVTREEDAQREASAGGKIGDDLTDSQLDDLWRGIVDGADSDTWAWFQDKPHQVAYRLLLRLTRAELVAGEAEVAGERRGGGGRPR